MRTKKSMILTRNPSLVEILFEQVHPPPASAPPDSGYSSPSLRTSRSMRSCWTGSVWPFRFMWRATRERGSLGVNQPSQRTGRRRLVLPVVHAFPKIISCLLLRPLRTARQVWHLQNGSSSSVRQPNASFACGGWTQAARAVHLSVRARWPRVD